MKTEYLGTLICAGTVLLITAIWTLCIMYQRATVKAPDLPEDYTQRDLFSVLGCLIVLCAAAMGV